MSSICAIYQTISLFRFCNVKCMQVDDHHIFIITGNYRQIYRPDERLSLFISSISEVSMRCLENNVRVDD